MRCRYINTDNTTCLVIGGQDNAKQSSFWHFTLVNHLIFFLSFAYKIRSVGLRKSTPAALSAPMKTNPGSGPSHRWWSDAQIKTNDLQVELAVRAPIAQPYPPHKTTGVYILTTWHLQAQLLPFIHETPKCPIHHHHY